MQISHTNITMYDYITGHLMMTPQHTVRLVTPIYNLRNSSKKISICLTVNGILMWHFWWWCCLTWCYVCCCILN